MATIPGSHKLARLEFTFKLLYFMQDLGLKSAKQAATAAWAEYIIIQSAIAEAYVVQT